MATIWLGDLRLKQLQLLFSEKETEVEAKYSALIDADTTWFNSAGTSQLSKMYTADAAVILMLGFNDCLYSCVWEKSYNIESIAKNYANSINKQIEQYQDLSFYICAVGPVSADYSFNKAKKGFISKDTLNAKIKSFNKTVLNHCKATYIDCYDYLTKTAFKTRDGVNYRYETLKNIREYILSQIVEKASDSLFEPRITKEHIPRPDHDTFSYWTTALNSCIEVAPGSGVCLPNCVGYAWGRFYEITGKVPKLSTGNAGTWFGKTSDGYERGKIPRAGAVICWSNNAGGAGHVAIVEQVNEDDSIIVSESAYREGLSYNPDNNIILGVKSEAAQESSWHFQIREIKKGANNWTDWSGYTFQGFIYCPMTASIDKSKVNTSATVSNSYGYLTRTQMEPNAIYIWQYLKKCGWTNEAIAAILGNIEAESTMNPTLGEYGGSGYGLTQWTPRSNLVARCKTIGLTAANACEDIDAQLAVINYEATNNVQWLTTAYKSISFVYDDLVYGGAPYNSLSFKEFIESKKDPRWLACVFAWCYERSAGTDNTDQTFGAFANLNAREERIDTAKKRGGNADHWYKFLQKQGLVSIEDKGLKVSNFKIDKAQATNIQFSFVTRNAKSGKYILKLKNTIIKQGKFTDNDFTVNGLKIIDLKDNKIKPNSEYSLFLEIFDENNSNKFSKTITVKIPQEYPTMIKTIKAACTEKIITPASRFKITVEPSETVCYWSSVNKLKINYILSLFVNGQKVAEKNISDLNSLKTLEISSTETFNYNKIKYGDTLQFGMRSYISVGGAKLYDSENFRCSEPFILLSNSTQVFLLKK